MGMNARGIINTSPLCVKAQVRNNQKTAQFTVTSQINRYSWGLNATTPPFSRQRNHFGTATRSLFVQCISCLWWTDVLVILHASVSHQHSCQCRWLPPAGYYSICHFFLLFFVVLLLFSSLPWHFWYAVHCAQCRWFLIPAETESDVWSTPNWLQLIWQQ